MMARPGKIVAQLAEWKLTDRDMQETQEDVALVKLGFRYDAVGYV